MKWTLQVVLFIAVISNVQAQVYLKDDAAVADGPVNIASNKINKYFVEPPAKFNLLKSANSENANIEVTYSNFPLEAKIAFDYAVSIWESLISSPVSIKILANWEDIDGNVLALSRPSSFHVNFEKAPLSNVYYPIALVEKLEGRNINNDEPDIICSFNKDFSWYFGIDGNTPTSKYDFVSSVLHEITHGLGFSGFLKNDGEKGYFNNDKNLPSIYDYYIFNVYNQQISDKSLFNSPSSELYSQLTSDKLKILKSNQTSAVTEESVNWLYAPENWNDGASIYHTKGTGYDHGLMTPFAYKGEAIHNPEGVALNILAALGWKSVMFNFEAFKDIEIASEKLAVNIGLLSDVDIDTSTVTLVFSTDYFSTIDSVKLKYDKAANKFTGNMPLNFHLGNIQYYFTAKSTDNLTFNFPAQAPQKKFALRVGPDYSSPNVVHNEVKLISSSAKDLEFTVFAHDNLGINSVKVEYKINGIAQEPVALNKQNNDNYRCKILFKEDLTNTSEIEYRIVAEDKSENKNKKVLPASGYYSVNVVKSFQPVANYSTDFENGVDDFVTADFSITPVAGFSNNILHTNSPYPVSALEDENQNLIAQLRYPIILQENGEMTFDEVVLVEPGEPQTTYNDVLFWDYVIVEGSKDGGISWLPLTEGYDSSDDELWLETFTSNLKSNVSNAAGSESMFLTQTVNLTNNTEFFAGDTILIRFRLASDKSVNGWGWAIDNLEIQTNTVIAQEGKMFQDEVNVFPNPFNSNFYVDCSNASDIASVNIEVTDMFGKTVYQKSGLDTLFDPKVKIDLPNENPGIYLVSISDGNSIISKNKLIKN